MSVWKITAIAGLALSQQPGYNKRLRGAASLIRHAIRALAAGTTAWTDDVWVVDSTPVECGRSRETAKRSDLAGWTEYGGAPRSPVASVPIRNAEQGRQRCPARIQAPAWR